MADQNGATMQEDATMGDNPAEVKGKGKAVSNPSHLMEEEEDSSDEETGAEDEVEVCS
jgi:hypothetical protein